MKTLLLTLGAALGLAAVQAHALTKLTDADADGRLTLEEIREVDPAVTPEIFASADGNGDGALDPTEVKAAIAAGILAAG